MAKIFEKNEAGFRGSSFSPTNAAHGVQMTFSNGYTISIQFGEFHYADAKLRPDGKEFESPNAEVAVFDPNGDFVGLTAFDDVLSRQTPEEVAALIHKYANIHNA